MLDGRSTTLAAAKWLTLLILAGSVLQVGAYGAKSSKASVLKSRLGSVEKKIKTLKYQIHVKKQQKKTVLGQLEVTESKLEQAQTGLAKNKIKLYDAQNTLNDTTVRLDRTKRQLARRRELLKRRVVGIYEGENLGYLNVVLGASDMWTFLTRAYYLQRILDSDTRLISEIKADAAAIERDKQLQARTVERISALQVRLEGERNRISSLADEKRNQLEAIEHSKDLCEQALDELEAKSQEIEEQIRRIQSMPGSTSRYAGVYRGGLMLPVHGRLSSPFGYRRHPITGVYKLHTGQDLACPIGTPVHAAGDGRVILAGWNGPYGYAVVIDHGGGVSTLYGHCSRLLVGVGENVKCGDVIAKSGSTGYSTGPHVHFEKRINGKPVNPL
jgi:murein DD-endopeptidase MepM/ murein hydrolase activator NlpD